MLALASSGCERERSRYATLAEARQAGAVERGWIPAWVPQGATELEEAHDPETGRQRLKFRAPAAELAALGGALPRLHVSRICPSRGAPAIEGSWPEAVEEGSAAWKLRYLSATSPEGRSLAVAIEGTSSTVYAWSCAGPAGSRSP